MPEDDLSLSTTDESALIAAAMILDVLAERLQICLVRNDVFIAHANIHTTPDVRASLMRAICRLRETACDLLRVAVEVSERTVNAEAT